MTPLLANGIDFPLVALFGLVTFGPLTLLVAVIESFVFKLHLKTGFRRVFRHVLLANVLSTLAGGMLYFVQDGVVHWSGILESIPAFARGYRWVAPLLIAGYFGVSVLVEGLQLVSRKVIAKIERPALATVRAVVLANACSYLLVGPLFYLATRPYFGGLETTFDARWTANPGLVVYYIDRGDHFVKRTRLGTQEATTLVPHPVRRFLVSADEATFVYESLADGFYAYRAGADEPIPIPAGGASDLLAQVGLSPDNRRLAFVSLSRATLSAPNMPREQTVTVMDLDARELVEIGSLPAGQSECIPVWSATRDEVCVLSVTRSQGTSTYVFAAAPPYGVREVRSEPPAQSELTLNFGRPHGVTAFPRGRLMSREFRAGQYLVRLYPYFGGYVSIRGDRDSVLLQNAYGLLNMNWPPITDVTALPAGGEFLVEWWGQTYLLSMSARRLGLALNGDTFVPRIPESATSYTGDVDVR